MAAATALAIASIATTAASVGLSAYGQSQAANASAAASRANAANLEQTAAIKEAEMHENLARQHREARRKLAGTRATMAASGTEINDGSNRDVLEIVTARLETAIADDARRQQMEQRAILQAASLERWKASQTKSAGFLSSVGTVLGGASSIAGDAYDFHQQGSLP